MIFNNLNLIFKNGRPSASGVKKSKKFGLIRDAWGGVGGSSLSVFRGFSKEVKKLKNQKLKIDQNMVGLRPPGGPGRVPQGRIRKRTAGNGAR